MPPSGGMDGPREEDSGLVSATTGWAHRAAGLVLLAVSASGAAAQGGPVTVEVEPISVERVVESATAVGTLLSAESADISPEVAGRIDLIAFDEGMPVTKGELLFRLDSAIYEAAVSEAEANYELKQRNFTRADELLANKVGTVRARDEAVSEMQVGKALLTLAQSRLDKMKIVAPFDGIVGLRNVSVGDYVEPGHTLVNLEKIDPIKVDFSVAERYLPYVRRGAEVRLTVDALGEQEFTGKVYAINPQIDPAGRSIALRAEVPNPDEILRPGLFARVRLETEVRDNALVVSEDAIVAQAGGSYVYRVVDDKAILTPVEIGQRRFGKVEILKGLSADDTVVVAGQLKLRDGAAVAPVPRDPPSASTPAPSAS
jgi:membrane fusion protein, multidrug efflux system